MACLLISLPPLLAGESTLPGSALGQWPPEPPLRSQSSGQTGTLRQVSPWLLGRGRWRAVSPPCFPAACPQMASWVVFLGRSQHTCISNSLSHLWRAWFTCSHAWSKHHLPCLSLCLPRPCPQSLSWAWGCRSAAAGLVSGEKCISVHQPE